MTFNIFFNQDKKKCHSLIVLHAGVQVVQVVHKPRQEAQRVQHGVEEASVAQVSEGAHTHHPRPRHTGWGIQYLLRFFKF